MPTRTTFTSIGITSGVSWPPSRRNDRADARVSFEDAPCDDGMANDGVLLRGEREGKRATDVR
jgi:hypothetical protein